MKKYIFFLLLNLLRGCYSLHILVCKREMPMHIWYDLCRLAKKQRTQQNTMRFSYYALFFNVFPLRITIVKWIYRFPLILFNGLTMGLMLRKCRGIQYYYLDVNEFKSIVSQRHIHTNENTKFQESKNKTESPVQKTIKMLSTQHDINAWCVQILFLFHFYCIALCYDHRI